MKININTEEVTISELEKIVEKLSIIIEEKKAKQPEELSALEQNILDNTKQVTCIRCHSTHVRKDGHDKRTHHQMYECADCGKKFNLMSGTIFRYTHLTFSKLNVLMSSIIDKNSIRKTAYLADVNTKTSYVWRLKLCNILSKSQKNTKVSGEIQADEKYENINLKGTKKSKMPRKSKKRQIQGYATRGINKEKVCIIGALDENDNIVLKIGGNGPVTKQMLEKYFVPKVSNVKVLITDCKSSYEEIAKKNNWNLVQIKSGKYVDENGYSLNGINSCHSDFVLFEHRFRGVSTKHLNSYLSWFIYDKMLNYTTEEIEKNEKLFKCAISYNTDIKYKNAFYNYSGINFDKVFA